MNDDEPATGSPVRDEEGGPCTQPGQGLLLTDAIVWARRGHSQEEIVTLLRQRYPGLPNDRAYGNPAAEAVMREIRRAQRTREGQRADLARLQAKGLPSTLAKGGDPDAPEPRPDYTIDDDDPDWIGPLHRDVTACEGDPLALLVLCKQHDIRLSLNDDRLHCSRALAADSELYRVLADNVTTLRDMVRRAKPVG